MAAITETVSAAGWLLNANTIKPVPVTTTGAESDGDTAVLYLDSNGALQIGGTLATGGTKIADLVLGAGTAGADIVVKTITPAVATYGWDLSGTASAAITTFKLTAGADSVTVSGAANNATVDGSAAGGDDTVTFAGEKTLGSITGTVDNSGSLLIQSLNGENYIKLGGGSKVDGSTIKGSTGGISLGGAAQHTLKAVETNGIANIALNKADAATEITVNGGTLTLTGDNNTTAINIEKVSVEGGTLAYSDVATFSEGSSITKSSLKAAEIDVTTGGTIDLKTANIKKNLAIDTSGTALGGAVDIDTLAAVVTHKTGTTGTLDLYLTNANNSNYHYDLTSTGNKTAVVYGGEMSIVQNGADSYNINSIGGDSAGKKWSLGASTATVVAKTGSTGDDAVTLDGNQVKTELTTGSGDDTITFGSAFAGNASVTAGGGVDVFDISNLAINKTAKAGEVMDYGFGKTKSEAYTSASGFDKIYVGKSFDETNNVSYDSNKGTLIVNGVTFKVADGSYVLIGTSTDGDIKNATYNSYLAEDGKLTLAATDVEPSDTTSTTGYDAADSTATDEFTTPTKDGGDTTNADTANARFKTAGTDDIKFLKVTDGSSWNTTIDMTSNGTSYVQIDKGATATGAIKMGKSNENNVVLIDNTADLSSVSFSDYKSTKDVIISKQQLDDYSDTAKYDTNNFISSTDGSFGSDLVGKGGSLTASSLKGGLYGAKYRQADIINDQVKTIYNEVLVVAGASAAGSYDATNATTQIFAMTNNNDTVADSVKGSKYDDVFVAGASDTIDGGAGNDVIYADEKKVTVKLATGSTADQDTINNWKSGSGTIQLAKGVEFSAISVTGFSAVTNQMIVGDGTGTNTKATFNTSGFANNAFVTTFKSDDTTKNALIYGAGGFNAGGAVATAADSVASAKLYVGAGNAGQLDFTGTGKGNIFLGHSEGTDGEFGDTAQYVNVKDVKSDSVGSAWVFGGSTKAQLTAGGDSDSLWGGGKNADTLISNGTYRTFFGTTNGAGVDSVKGFKTGADAFGETTDTDVIYFVDGVDLSAMKVSGNNLVVGSSSTSGLAISIADMAGDSTTNGALITYALGLDGKKNVAKVDVTTDNNTNGEVTFEEDAQLYIGRGDKTTITFGENNGNAVRFGFESQYSGYNVRNLDATDAVAGSLVNGSTDRAQRVKASEKGASSIAGGFGDGFKDGNSDTLVGGNDDSFGTTFFVGKDMGSDQILQLSGNDTVVFLNTKLSDITNNVNTDTYGKTMSVVFNTGSRVSINSDNNIADLENVTLQLADGKFTYDATAKSWVQA